MKLMGWKNPPVGKTPGCLDAQKVEENPWSEVSNLERIKARGWFFEDLWKGKMFAKHK